MIPLFEGTLRRQEGWALWRGTIELLGCCLCLWSSGCEKLFCLWLHWAAAAAASCCCFLLLLVHSITALIVARVRGPATAALAA